MVNSVYAVHLENAAPAMIERRIYNGGDERSHLFVAKFDRLLQRFAEMSMIDAVLLDHF